MAGAPGVHMRKGPREAALRHCSHHSPDGHAPRAETLPRQGHAVVLGYPKKGPGADVPRSSMLTGARHAVIFFDQINQGGWACIPDAFVTLSMIKMEMFMLPRPRVIFVGAFMIVGTGVFLWDRYVNFVGTTEEIRVMECSKRIEAWVRMRENYTNEPRSKREDALVVAEVCGYVSSEEDRSIIGDDSGKRS